ncbi:MAG: hypothetical protein ACRDUY_05640 [Nitriliruptorales bacterium]
MTEGQIDGLVRRRAFETVLYGVYRLAGSAVPHEQRGMAAVLRCWPTARLSGPYVLGLLGVEGFSLEDPFVVLVPRDRQITNVPFRTVRTSWPLVRGPTARNIPIVAPGRAFMDAAPLVTDRRLIVGIDSAGWRGTLRPDRLVTTVRRDPRHPGSRVILRLLAQGVFEQESMGERELKPVLDGIDPPGEWGVWVAPDIKVDFFWRDCQMAIEYAGRDHHTSAPQREKDAVRDARLRMLGIYVVHVTKEDLRDPDALHARLLAIRATLLRRP